MRQLAERATHAAPMQVWRNPTKPHHSLRLTQEGRVWIKKYCHLPEYQFKIESVSNHQLLQLDHLITAPYFLQNRTVLFLFGETDAIMLELHASNLAAYLDSLSLDS